MLIHPRTATFVPGDTIGVKKGQNDHFFHMLEGCVHRVYNPLNIIIPDRNNTSSQLTDPLIRPIGLVVPQIALGLADKGGLAPYCTHFPLQCHDYVVLHDGSLWLGSPLGLVERGCSRELFNTINLPPYIFVMMLFFGLSQIF